MWVVQLLLPHVYDTETSCSLWSMRLSLRHLSQQLLQTNYRHFDVSIRLLLLLQSEATETRRSFTHHHRALRCSWRLQLHTHCRDTQIIILLRRHSHTIRPVWNHRRRRWNDLRHVCSVSDDLLHSRSRTRWNPTLKHLNSNVNSQVIWAAFLISKYRCHINLWSLSS